MTALRHAFSKATVQGALALMLVATACALALQHEFESAAGFATLAMVPLSWYFRGTPAGPDK